jgi:hypothetical protein
MSAVARKPLFRFKTRGIRLDWRKLLLACGVASILLYVGMDVLASLLYDGYSYKDQTISELSAIDAPTRSFWLPLGLIYTLLVIAFGVGVWRTAGDRRALRIVAACAVGVGLTGFIWPFAPMHQREVLAAGGETLSDTLHLILGGVNTILFLTGMAFGAATLGGRFRLYTIATIFIVLIFGFLMSLETPNVADNEPTPWLGVFERIAIEGSLLWFAILAVVLLRRTTVEDVIPAREAEARP